MSDGCDTSLTMSAPTGNPSRMALMQSQDAEHRCKPQAKLRHGSMQGRKLPPGQSLRALCDGMLHGFTSTRHAAASYKRRRAIIQAATSRAIVSRLEATIRPRARRRAGARSASLSWSASRSVASSMVVSLAKRMTNRPHGLLASPSHTMSTACDRPAPGPAPGLHRAAA